MQIRKKCIGFISNVERYVSRENRPNFEESKGARGPFAQVNIARNSPWKTKERQFKVEVGISMLDPCLGSEI